MISPSAIIFLKWQYLHCMQKYAGEIERDLTAVEYLPTTFICQHDASTVNGVRDFFQCYEKVLALLFVTPTCFRSSNKS